MKKQLFLFTLTSMVGFSSITFGMAQKNKTPKSSIVRNEIVPYALTQSGRHGLYQVNPLKNSTENLRLPHLRLPHQGQPATATAINNCPTITWQSITWKSLVLLEKYSRPLSIETNKLRQSN